MINKNSNIAIVIVTRYPDNVWLNFLNNFYYYDIFVVIDNNDKDFCKLFEKSNSKINFIQIEDNFCKSQGFYNSLIPYSNVPNKVLSWDKALYYFCKINNNYDKVWIIEEDVFFLKEDVILNIDNSYPDSDLLTAFNEVNYDGDKNGWPHWNCAEGKLNLPWAHSMVCMCRLSNRLLDEVRKYVDNNNILVYHELLFNTLAIHNNFKIDCPKELSTIQWNTTWDINNLDLNNCYHPIKNIQDHNLLRQINMIYFHNLFNDYNYNLAENFNFNKNYFLWKNLPDGFNFCCYRENNNMKDLNDESVIFHWFKYGKFENRKYKD